LTAPRLPPGRISGSRPIPPAASILPPSGGSPPSRRSPRRAALPRRQPGAGPSDDRAVPPAPQARAGRMFSGGPGLCARVWSGIGQGGVDRWHEMSANASITRLWLRAHRAGDAARSGEIDPAHGPCLGRCARGRDAGAVAPARRPPTSRSGRSHSPRSTWQPRGHEAVV